VLRPRAIGSGTALVAAAACCAPLAAGAGAAARAAAAPPRSQRTVAGVRATINQYDNDVLAGHTQAACNLMTAAAQARIAHENHDRSCAQATTLAHELLTANPRQAARLRAYGKTVRVTLHAATATVPNMDGGRSTLTYTRGLWYLS
jgi:hypothetical protein